MLFEESLNMSTINTNTQNSNPLINTGASNASSASGSASASSASATSAAAIQNEFLTLFTTQLKNQDPLNPMDSSQMTSQLAQISTVSGIQTLNQTMQSMMTSNTAVQASQSAALIGKTVMGPGSQFAWNGTGSAQIGVSLPSNADSVSVNILDAAGQTVRSFSDTNQSAGTSSITWDGKDSSGNILPAGNYTVKASASKAGAAVTAATLVQGVVTGVTSNSSGVSLTVQGGGSVPLNSITQIN
jgi:flagellar basal-body rod modification protein FlgD